MSLLDVLLGKPLASTEERAEKIAAVQGIPIFGLDALGSAAYGPEAALTVLLPLGLLGVRFIVPIMAAIMVLLTIVYFSYRQTIAAYPGGGDSYTVASQNLGTFPGLLAGSALIVDYVLVVAVGIAAGVGALVSAVPKLQPDTLELCLAILLLITLVNLRGVHETSMVFMVPTYLFVACLGGALFLGIWKMIVSGAHPVPVVAPPKLGPPQAMLGAWLLVRAYANGCTALTGVEAVSNGVMAFREPKVKYARRTLTTIIGILILMLAGVALLSRAYHIAATTPGRSGYESVLSQLIGAVAGKGHFYYLAIGSILLVLVLQANTAFADFPRVCRAIARGRISAARICHPWTTARLLPGHLRAGVSFGGAADCLRRHHRSLDSVICGGRVHGIHAFTGGNGSPLEAHRRSACARQSPYQCIRRYGNGGHRSNSHHQQIHRRSVDYAAGNSRTVTADVCRSPSL